MRRCGRLYDDAVTKAQDLQLALQARCREVSSGLSKWASAEEIEAALKADAECERLAAESQQAWDVVELRRQQMMRLQAFEEGQGVTL